MIFIKQSTAVTLLVGPFLDDTDGKTAETGLTITRAEIRLSKNGGDMAQKNEASSLTHDELGYYTCPLDTTDTNTLGILKLMVHESGALPVWMEISVLPANVYDSMFSTDLLQVDATQLLGTAISTPATAGILDVNVKQISSDATAADNCELAFDGTGYAGGTIKQGVNVVAMATDTVTADALKADAVTEIKDGVFAGVIENSKTLLTMIRLMYSALCNKVTGGATTTITFRDDADSKDRLIFTVDADGNRTAVTKDGV